MLATLYRRGRIDSLITTPPPPPPATTKRFRVGSWYEKPLPTNAPIHPQNAEFIARMVDQGLGKPNAIDLRLNIDAGGTLAEFCPGSYITTSSDPLYHIRDFKGTCPDALLPGGAGIRIPTVAKTYYPLAGANDSPMQIWTRAGVIGSGSPGYYFWSAMMLWDPNGTPIAGDADVSGCWQLGGTDPLLLVGASIGVYYTASYGHAPRPTKNPNDWPAQLLRDDAIVRSPDYYIDEPLNGKQNLSDNGLAAQRGLNAMIRAVNYDRTMADGTVNHVMEMFTSAGTSDASAWPVPAYESNKGGIFPQGTRMRIKPSVDLVGRLNADGRYGNASGRTASQLIGFNQALALCKGLQTYGLIVADTSGANSKIKLSSTVKDGRGNLWVVTTTGLRELPFTTDWEFIAQDYDPPG